MNTFRSAHEWVLKILVFALPLFFLPITSDFFDFNKLGLLVVGVSFGLLLWALSTSENPTLRITPFDLPVLGFAAAFLVSTLLAGGNKMESFVFPGTTTLVLALTALYFLIVQSTKGENWQNVLSVTSLLSLGGALAGFIAFLSGSGALALLEASGAPAWVRETTFTTAGGPIAAITLFVALLPLSLTRVFDAVKSKRLDTNAFFHIAVSLFLVLGLFFQGYAVLRQGASTVRFLPPATGWSIALETAKLQPLFGVGAGNFLEAFNRFRPVEYNQTDSWNLRFTSSSNWYLHLFTVAGLVGFAAFAWLVWNILRNGKLRETAGGRDGVLYSLYSILILFLLVPANLLLIFAFYVLLAVLAGELLGHNLHFSTKRMPELGGVKTGFSLFSGLLSLVVAAVGTTTFYFGLPIARAEAKYKQALSAVARNDGIGTYNHLREVIRLNPAVVHYRITNSQVNLALANSIAANASQKAEVESEAKQGQISEQDRNNISQLVQQAIAEAKSAVNLNPDLSTSWVNLAQIYRSIMTLARGADQFSIGAYQQAIALEPTNPNLRIEFGGVLYALKQYDEAAKSFELAVAAKPDLANAHYNLAVALRDQGKTERAAAEMRQTLALVKPGTQDYDTVQGELGVLEKKLAEATSPAQVGSVTGEQPALQAPQPAPSPIVQPPLSLPEGSEPPAPSASGGSPTPTPTP